MASSNHAEAQENGRSRSNGRGSGHQLRCRSKSRSLSNLFVTEEAGGPMEEADTKKAVDQRMELRWNVTALVLIVTISIATLPSEMATPHPTVWHVWYYGWISAVSTGFGALPFFFWTQPSGKWLGISNAVAAGMMISASYSLIAEAFELESDKAALYGQPLSQSVRAILGAGSGMIFVAVCQYYFEEHDDITVGNVTGLEASKILLMMGVMTLHSFAEGLGIGVAFCGADGTHLGAFISTTLAIHNVPEGLAVALILVPRGVSKLKTFIWCICTSLPQPLIATPVFLFVEAFVVWQSVGLGFAAGAMLWVACFELIPDATKTLSFPVTAAILAASFLVMLSISSWLDVATK